MRAMQFRPIEMLQPESDRVISVSRDRPEVDSGDRDRRGVARSGTGGDRHFLTRVRDALRSIV